MTDPHDPHDNTPTSDTPTSDTNTETDARAHAHAESAAAAGPDGGTDSDAAPKKKRRRRRGKKKAAGSVTTAEHGEGAEATDSGSAEASNDTAESEPSQPRAEREHRSDNADHDPHADRPAKKKRRRKGRGGGGGESGGDELDRMGGRAERRGPDESDNAEVFDQDMTFADLDLKDEVLQGLADVNFSRPTYIQAKLIPLALKGVDVLGQAKTGTGKTAAFGLPLLNNAEPGVPMQAIILAPTRELAIQITDEINVLGKHTKLTAITIYGGQRIHTQVEKLERGPEIIVGTPGRVMDMIQRGYLHFHNIRFAVLDEVDRMFDIGFRDDIRRLLGQCPKDRQTLVVSATINPEIEDLARRYMRNPEKIVTSAGSLTASMVEQHYLTVEAWDKKRLLTHLLTHEEPGLTLVFCRLKRTVDTLAEHLNRKGIESHAIHGDMTQSKRSSTMKRFKDGKLAVLIASDLASRGIDVEGISHVVNYDLPDDPDLYVHRIGRTARAGSKGVAWSFVTAAQGKLLTQIENLVNAEIPRLDYPDFEANERPASWRDEPTGGYAKVEVLGAPEARSRFEDEDPTAVIKQSSEKDLAAKFPGGIVPSKMPPKRMGGKVRTRGR